MKNTNEKGITLVALVITIIIMIILVGVTVAISINSGLITTTKTAADDTENARIEDEIKTIIVTVLEGNEIKDEETLTKLKNKIKNIQGIDQVTTDITSNNPIIVKSKSNKGWTIDKKGKLVGYDKMIKFNINVNNENGSEIIDTKTYYAEDGMTFKEWIDKYKPNGLTIIEKNILMDYSGEGEYLLKYDRYGGVNLVYIDEKIIPEYDYFFCYYYVEHFNNPESEPEPEILIPFGETSLDSSD